MHPNKSAFSQVISAAAVGTILEWYDFSLYAYLAPIMAKLFFPQHNDYVSLMLAYVVFAAGFLIRPFGAIFFGHLGDKIGRRKILILSIFMMAVATCMLGLLPTYEQIGIMAPIALIILRLVQGISVSGESVGSIVFVIESAPQASRGVTGGLVWVASTLGILMSSIAIAIVSGLLSEAAFQAWGWRILFILGIFTGLIGFYLRKKTNEPAHFQNVMDEGLTVQFPVIEAIRKYWPKMLISMGTYVLCATITYLLFVFMPTYVAENIGIPRTDALFINTSAMLLLIVLIPTVGWLSDRLGRKIFLLASNILFVLLSYPLYVLINHGTLLSLFGAQICFALIAACYQGTLTTALLENFPAHIRYSSVVVTYNISYLLFGGTAPLIVTYLIHTVNNNLVPGIYLTVIAIISFIAIIKLPETYKNILSHEALRQE